MAKSAGDAAVEIEDEYTRLLLLQSAQAFAVQHLAVTVALLDAWAADGTGDGSGDGVAVHSDGDLGSWDDALDAAEPVFGQANVEAARELLKELVQRSLGDFVA